MRPRNINFWIAPVFIAPAQFSKSGAKTNASGESDKQEITRETETIATWAVDTETVKVAKLGMVLGMVCGNIFGNRWLSKPFFVKTPL